MCLKRSSLESMISPPFGDGRVGLRFGALRSGHPGPCLKVEFPDEVPILAHVAVQRRMVDLVHRDLEPAYGPLGHARFLHNGCYHVITPQSIGISTRREAKNEVT